MRTDRPLASLASVTSGGLLLAAVVVGANLVGCPGDLENPDRFDFDAQAGETSAPTCDDVPTTILRPTCAAAGCHSATDALAGLDLETTPIGPRLVGKAATGGPGLIIDPDVVEDSVLLTKLESSPPFGSPMPLGGSLTDEQIQCLRAWVVEQVEAAAADAGETDADDAGEADADDAGGDEAGSDAPASD